MAATGEQQHRTDQRKQCKGGELNQQMQAPVGHALAQILRREIGAVQKEHGHDADLRDDR